MYIGHFTTPGTLLNQVAPRRLLVVAPQTPAEVGSNAVNAFLDQAANQRDLHVELVDSAPWGAYCASRHGLLELTVTLASCRSFWRYLRTIPRCDAVLFFADTSVIFSWAFLLLWWARLWHKRFLLKPIGGDLDLRLAAQGIQQQHELIHLFNQMDGIFTETIQLQQALQQLGVTCAYYVPAWCARPTSQPLPQPHANSASLRLLYLSPIRPDQGPYELLHALQQMAYQSQYPVTCDFFGPIATEDDRRAFLAELMQTPQARYGGVIEPSAAINVMAHYDALVLPTYCATDEYPGVILDAMTAGLPIISTLHRAIPELVQQGVNGLLAPVQDSVALKEAIIQLAQNPPLRQRMGVAGYNMAQTFRVDQVVPQLFQLIFPTK